MPVVIAAAICFYVMYFGSLRVTPHYLGGVNVFTGRTIALLGNGTFTLIIPMDAEGHLDSGIKEHTLVLVDLSAQTQPLTDGINEDVPPGSDVRTLLEQRLKDQGIRMLLWSSDFRRKARSYVIETSVAPGVRAAKLRYFLFVDEDSKLYYPPEAKLGKVDGA